MICAAFCLFVVAEIILPGRQRRIAGYINAI